MNPTSLIDNHQVISFDIFDTLILRPYIRPVDIFHHIERITGLKKFARNRILAERKARKLKNGKEVTYDEIYEQLGRKYKSAYDFELSFEKRICLRNEETYKWYQYALEKGKTVIIISDMYLDKEIIEEILTNAGYQNYAHLFLSSYHQKTKSDGDLYDLAIETLKVAPESILHIGDNMHSDYDMANSKGIQAIQYPRVIDRYLKKNPNLNALLRKNTDKRFVRDDLTISLVLGLNAILWIERSTKDYWSHIGALYAAPLLYFFTRWIYESAKENNTRNIAIVARDGFNIIEIFRLFDKQKQFNPHYVYLPRYVAEVSNLHTVDDIHLFFNELGDTPESLIRFINDIASENRQISILWEDFLKETNHPNKDDMKDFILTHQHLFINSSGKRRNLVFDYLSQKGLLDNDIMFVDSATTQARAQKLIRNILIENNLNYALYGYYYKINKRHKNLDQRDVRPYQDKKYRTDKWDIMEYFMSAPEKPILSIRKEGNEFLPVYENIDDNEHEQTRIKTCVELSKGVMLFAEKAYKIFEDHQLIKDLDTVVVIINNLINNPSTRDIANTKKLHHTINNDGIYNPIITSHRRLNKNIPSIFEQKIHVQRISPYHEHYFMGENGGIMVQDQGEEILATNVAFMDKAPYKDEIADIYRINRNGTKLYIDSTTAWNLRKGACLQYRPRHPNEIIYNKHDHPEAVATILNLDTCQTRTLPIPVACLSKDGKKALSLGFPQQGIFHSYYTFIQCRKSSDPAHFHDPGIYIIDLDSGKYNRIISAQRLVEKLNITPEKIKEVFVDTISFGEQNYNFSISLRVTSTKGKYENITLSYDEDGKLIHLPHKEENFIFEMGEKIIRQDKYSAEEEKTYSQAETLQRKDPRGCLSIAEGDEELDITNISYSHDKIYSLFETLATREFPYIKLYLINNVTGKKTILGYFYSNPEYFHSLLPCRLELNPRWSQCGNHIFIDSIHEGYRAIYHISASEVIAKLNNAEQEPINENELRNIISTELPIKKQNRFLKFRRKTKELIIRTLNFLTNNRLFVSH